MAGSLEGPLAKWTRAKSNLLSLNTEISEVWPPTEIRPVRSELHRAGLECRFYVGPLPEIKPDWALAIGEILFDLRSALDHLAYQLHVRRWRNNIPKDVRLANFKRPIQVDGATQFPIYDSEAAWASHFYRIATLSKRDRTALQHLQPYIRRDDKWSVARWALSRLNSWHNWDKHRKLHLITAAKDSTIIVDPTPAFRIDAETFYGAVKPYGEIERWTFSKAPQEPPHHPGAFLNVAIQEPGDDPDATLSHHTLQILASSVLRVIERFADRF